jgi:hypothetical protein
VPLERLKARIHTGTSMRGEAVRPKRYRAYSRLAFELARDHAPAAAIATNASRDFFSARMGCQIYQPVFGMDLAALCLRAD